MRYLYHQEILTPCLYGGTKYDAKSHSFLTPSLILIGVSLGVRTIMV